MKTISILGSGWLGLPLVKHCVSLGYSVKASVRSEARQEEIQSFGAAPFVIDIDALTESISSFLQADILIVNVPSKHVPSFINLVKEVDASPVQQVLFVSSTSVYEMTQGVITEADDDALVTGHPLVEIEKLFQEHRSTTVVRFSGLIGPKRHPGRFFRSGKPVRYPDAPINLIHLDDCIGIIHEIILQGAWGEVFNGCADTHPTKREFYAQAALALGYPVPEFEPVEMTPFKVISNEKVKGLLNYMFQHPNLMHITF